MFDGMLQTDFPPNATRTSARINWLVVTAIILALLGATLTVMLPTDPSDGFHIEFIAP